MLVDLTREEIEYTIEAVDMRRDSAIDTKQDLESDELNTQIQYVESLQGIINKLQNALHKERP